MKIHLIRVCRPFDSLLAVSMKQSDDNVNNNFNGKMISKKKQIDYEEISCNRSIKIIMNGMKRNKLM